MPWSGGVYTRGYASWTNDANSSLPISATKFDTEDNDFASGLNNCLTIDGLNKPTATLAWAQIINLTRGTDGNMFSVGRTGGSNNPLLTASLTDASGVTWTISGGSLFFTGGVTNFNRTTDGNTWAMARTGGSNNPSLTANVTDATGTLLTAAGGELTVQQGGVNGLTLNAGTANTNHSLLVQNQAASSTLFEVQGDGQAYLIQPPAYNAGPTNAFQAGYLDGPPRGITASGNVLITDRGKVIVITGTTAAQTLTIQAHASVAYAPGHLTLILNKSNQNWSLAITSDTLTFLPNNTTGTRTLAAGAMATIYNDGTASGTSWEVWGGGIS